MNRDPVITGAALMLHQHPTGRPAAVSVRLTGRIFQNLHVQLAAAENLEASPGRHPLDTQPIALRALTGPLEVRLDTRAPADPASHTEVDLELTIDDGDPAGPYTLTRRLGTLPSDAAEHTVHATFAPHSLARPTDPARGTR